MVAASRYGQLAHDTTASGATAWLTGMVVLSTRRVMSTRVNGPKIRQMGTEFTPISTVVDTKASGLLTNSMDLALNSGQMVQSMMANTNKE